MSQTSLEMASVCASIKCKAYFDSGFQNSLGLWIPEKGLRMFDPWMLSEVLYGLDPEYEGQLKREELCMSESLSSVLRRRVLGYSSLFCNSIAMIRIYPSLHYTVTVDSPSLGGHYSHKLMKIEKLTFYNHTECTCQDRTDEMPRDTDLKTGLDTNRIPNQPAPYRCKCPSEYTVRNLANGSCTCDCFDKQRDCTKYKKGKENFNHHDRICIETGKCTIPSCDFGVFNRRLGRCPRKHEKFRSWPRYKA
nr:uncharacterized protein LOC106688247 [Halyomorpha halys]